MFAGCAGATRNPPVPSSEALVATSASVVAPMEGTLSAWTRAPASEQLFAVGPSEGFVSVGHGRDRFKASLRVSDQAAFGAAKTRAAGFVVCALHTESRPPTLLLCMRKESGEAGDWRYGVAEGYAAPFRRVGKLADCSACHGVGPWEGLFDAR